MQFSTLEQDVLNRAKKLLGDTATGSIGNALTMLEKFAEMNLRNSPDYVVREQTYFGETGNFALDSAIKSIVNIKDLTAGISDDKLFKLSTLLTAVCHAYLFNSVNRVLFKGCALPGDIFEEYMSFSLNKLIGYFVYDSEDYFKYIKDGGYLENLFQVLDILREYADNHVAAYVNEEIVPSWCFNITFVPEKGFTLHYVINISNLAK